MIDFDEVLKKVFDEIIDGDEYDYCFYWYENADNGSSSIVIDADWYTVPETQLRLQSNFVHSYPFTNIDIFSSIFVSDLIESKDIDIDSIID